MTTSIQLTESGAVVPYGICLDSQDCIWVASKGGVFRFDQNGLCLFSDKHDRPKQISAFSSVRFVVDKENPKEGKVLVKYADDNGSFLVVYDLAGMRVATSILDSPVKGVAVTENGDIFLTSQPNVRRSEILRGHIDDVTTFEPITASSDFQFEHLCCVQENQLLIVSCARLPIGPYSEQSLKVINYNGDIVSSFSRGGKENGEVQWPRAIEISAAGNVIILDRTGRLQEFDFKKGIFLRLLGDIPTGLGNCFCIDKSRNQLLVTCSGLVLNQDEHAECNDWIERVSTAA